MQFKVTAKQIEGDDGLAITLRGLNTDPSTGIVIEQLIAKAKGPAMKELQVFEPHQIVEVPFKAPV